MRLERTYEELKLQEDRRTGIVRVGLERTYEELKHVTGWYVSIGGGVV